MAYSFFCFQISVDQQYAFIDYISHLVNADYALVAEDLVKLGFVPPELVDPEKTASVVPQLGRVLGELVQGGGARKINFQQVSSHIMYIFINWNLLFVCDSFGNSSVLSIDCIAFHIAVLISTHPLLILYDIDIIRDS